jgi:hypothetical protein
MGSADTLSYGLCPAVDLQSGTALPLVDIAPADER